MDAGSWSERERRYKKKFAAGRKHIPKLFDGVEVPEKIEQIAVFVFASTRNHTTIAGGRIVLIQDILKEIVSDMAARPIDKNVVPEQYPLLRTIQFVTHYKAHLWGS